VKRTSCIYCDNGHIYVCDCGHSHNDHVQGGGCKHRGCECQQYSQRRQRLPEETTKQFEARIVAKPTKIKRTYTYDNGDRNQRKVRR